MTATLGLPGVDFVPRVSAERRADKQAAQEAAEKDDQHTPQWLLDLVAEIWPKGIDVDPCWSPGSLVRARLTYDGTSSAQDGLAQPWTGDRAWCNPPYSGVGPWADRVAAHVVASLTSEALLLVNTATTVKWWRRWRPIGQTPRAWWKARADAVAQGASGIRAAEVAFFNKRIGFLKDGAARGQNRFDQKLLYWGVHGRQFAKVFREVAWVP